MKKLSLGLIGVGSFGSFAAKHLARHFSLVLHDPFLKTGALAKKLKARAGNLKDAASCDIVVLAVPVQKMRDVLAEIAPHLKKGALVIDVASVKIRPVAAMRKLLPRHVALVGTHPLFGPQSGKKSIKGLNIAVCEIRGRRGACVAKFCKEKLGLRAALVTPEEHDREAAYVQGLTHMLAKIVVSLDLPDMRFPTKTYELMQEMVEMVRYDSDELFRAIERENPFSCEAKKSFFAAFKDLEKRM